MSNIDKKTVSSFSDEWTSFKQNNLQIKEHEYLFNKYDLNFRHPCTPIKFKMIKQKKMKKTKLCIIHCFDLDDFDERLNSLGKDLRDDEDP